MVLIGVLPGNVRAERTYLANGFTPLCALPAEIPDMTVRDARLPQDEPAILSFITGLQDYEAAFEPNRRRDPGFRRRPLARRPS